MKPNVNWKYDKNGNRLLAQVAKPEPTVFHKETSEYLEKLRQRRDLVEPQSLIASQQLNKQFASLSVSPYQKVALIREQVRKIEQQAQKKEHIIKARVLEQQEREFHANQMLIKEIKGTKNNYPLQHLRRNTTIAAHLGDINKFTKNKTKHEEDYALTEIEKLRNKINLLSAFE